MWEKCPMRCNTPISHKLFCAEGDEVQKSEIAFGYKLNGHDYLVLDKKEIDSAKPISSKLIELDKFIEFFQVDPHYFDRTFLLIPNNSEKPYALLRKVLEQTGLAAIDNVTMSTKERVVLNYYYQNAIVATTCGIPMRLQTLHILQS
jgi:DNA end-binding protein Ku